MELNRVGKRIVVMGLYLLTSSQAYSGSMNPIMLSTAGKAYASVFGGAGASNNFNMNQYGTDFYTEVEGGSFAINAFGSTNSGTVGIVGGNVGYQWPTIVLNLFTPLSGLAPATELEGYYLGKSTLTGHDFNSNTTADLE